MLLITFAVGFANSADAQEEQLTEQDHEREKLGMNAYTAPSIARVFQQLDGLKSLPFGRLWRDFPQASPPDENKMELKTLPPTESASSSLREDSRRHHSRSLLTKAAAQGLSPDHD